MYFCEHEFFKEKKNQSTEKLKAGLISSKGDKTPNRTVWMTPMTLALKLKLRGNIHTVLCLILAIFILCPTQLSKKKKKPTFLLLICF